MEKIERRGISNSFDLTQFPKYGGGKLDSIVKDKIIDKYSTAIEDTIDNKYYDGWLRIIEENPEAVEEAFRKFMGRLEKTTMMIRYPRMQQYEHTTTRAKHLITCKDLAGKIAENLGLSVTKAQLMARYHDIGHVFYAHPGERALSLFLTDEGLGPFYHNAEGARKLLRDNIVEKIIIEINNQNKEQNKSPMCKKDKSLLRKGFWEILDGIAGHNGEKQDSEVYITKGRTKKDLEEDISKCYVKQGYDREMKLATPEAALLRFVDIISYVSRDLADAVREGVLTQLDDSYAQILSKLDIDDELIEEINGTLCKIKERKRNNESVEDLNIDVNDKLQKMVDKVEAVLCDSVQYDRKNGIIKMDKDVMNSMYNLRGRNQEEILKRVTKVREEQIVEQATGDLIYKIKEEFEKEHLDDDLMEKRGKIDIGQEMNERMEEYGLTGIGTFFKNGNKEDFERTKGIAKVALENSIREEVNQAAELNMYNPVPVDAKLLKKVIRINEHAKDLRKKYNGVISEEQKEAYIQRILQETQKDKNDTGYLSQKDAIIIETLAQYIGTLDDMHYIDSIHNMKIISDEEYNFLRTPYKDSHEVENSGVIAQMKENQEHDAKIAER